MARKIFAYAMFSFFVLIGIGVLALVYYLDHLRFCV